MSESFDHITGKVIINARFVTQEGQADEFAKALKEIQEYALSDQEPGCLTYRIARSENNFLVFEQYENSAAILEHRNTPPYKSMMSRVQAGTLIEPGSRKVTFYEEV